MDYLVTLNELIKKFGITASGSGLERTLTIQPPAELSGPNGMALSETVRRIAQIDVPIKVDLAFLGKWVRSLTPNLPPDPGLEDPIGGMPVVEQLVLSAANLSNTLPPASLMNSDPGSGTVPGVPEVLGRIKGTISQVVERLTDIVERRPITLSLRWRVLDESTPGSTSAASVEYRLNNDAAWAAMPDPLGLPTGGVPAGMSLSLRFPLRFTELTTSVPDVMTMSVRVSLKLSLTPPGADELQRVSMSGTVTGGTFTLTFTHPIAGAGTTGMIPFNATADVVQSALEALAGIEPGDVLCAGGPLPSAPITIRFQGALGGRDVAQITVAPALTGTGATVTVATTIPGGGAAPIETGWIELPPVPLIVPTVPVPTIVVLCEHREFSGRKLVLVPSNSVIGSAIGIGDALNLTRSALQSLSSANALIGFLGGTAGGRADTASAVLTALSPSAGQTIIAAHSQVDDLSINEYEFDPGFINFFGIRIGRVSADNITSSIICIGRSGTVFNFFHEPALSEAITRLQVTLDGSLGCALWQLDQVNPNIVYGSSFGNPALGNPVSYGGTLTSFRPNGKHEDAITSLNFMGPTVRFSP